MSYTQPASRRRINARAIIYKDGKIFAVRHKTNDGTTAPYYAVPGGGLDEQESLTDGLTREIIEETGVTPVIGRLLFIQQYATEKKGFNEELELFFEVKNPRDYEHIDLGSTSHGNDEIAICEFVVPRAVKLLPKFLSEIDIADYCEHDRPVLIVDNFNEIV